MKRIFTIFVAAGTLWGLALTAPASADLSSAVASLDVAAEQRAGYDRDKFGDYDRDKVLARNFKAFDSCDGYFSRYDNICYALADFGGDKSRADDEVDIDHRVALAEAWDSGAHAWGAAKRDQFAGDARNLNVMTDNLNSSKSDQDIAEWTPTDALCHYVRAYVATKVAYDLTVDQAEKSTLVDLVERCDPGGGQPPGNDGDGGDGSDELAPAPKPTPVEGDLVVTG